MTHKNPLDNTASPFDQTGLNPSQRERASAYLQRVEALVALVFEAAASIRAIAKLLAGGFNLMRHRLRITDFGAAFTRLGA